MLPAGDSSSEHAMSRVELIARCEQDLVGGFPDYAIWAGAQLIGRIYQRHATGGH